MPLQEQMWICQTKQVPCQMCSLMVGSNYYFIKKKKKKLEATNDGKNFINDYQNG
jgi:hypothetical protein